VTTTEKDQLFSVDRQIAEDAVPAAQAAVVKASQRWKERKHS
jgi:hypothetical protein